VRYFFLILAIFLLPMLTTSPAKISNTNELIAAMQNKYGKSWYKTATFVQQTTNFQPDGTSKVETWYEAMSVPGSLRIDFTPTSAGNGILFTDGKIFVFKDGKVDTMRPFEHPLLILGFDIYRSPASEVTAKLQALKFDLSQFREDTWQGRAVYVVGAKAGDLHSPQFWIDQENLYFVRMLSPGGKDGKETQETQFNKYHKLGGGWMAPEVIFMVDGKVVTTEKYSEIRGDVTLDPFRRYPRKRSCSSLHRTTELAPVSFILNFHLCHELYECGRLSDPVQISITLEEGIRLKTGSRRLS
jgi:outer membrane lipoprotein-sorting protein